MLRTKKEVGEVCPIHVPAYPYLSVHVQFNFVFVFAVTETNQRDEQNKHRQFRFQLNSPLLVDGNGSHSFGDKIFVNERDGDCRPTEQRGEEDSLPVKGNEIVGPLAGDAQDVNLDVLNRPVAEAQVKHGEYRQKNVFHVNRLR